MAMKTFEHPQHGTIETPENVLASDKFSDTEKQTIIEEWRSSLQHILLDDPDAPEVKETSERLERAARTLDASKS